MHDDLPSSASKKSSCIVMKSPGLPLYLIIPSTLMRVMLELALTGMSPVNIEDDFVMASCEVWGRENENNHQ